MSEIFGKIKLPLELAIEILSLVSASSQANYQSLLLVSNKFSALAVHECLRDVPIVLETYQQIAGFSDYMQMYPEQRNKIHHLWIIPDDEVACIGLIDSILKLTTNIVSLSCTSESLTHLLCSSPTFHHTQCVDLTLVRTPLQELGLWRDIMKSPHAAAFCAQIRRLCLVREGLKMEFPRHHFLNLSHLAFSSRPVKGYIQTPLNIVKSLPALDILVVTVFLETYSPRDTTFELLELDPRLCFLQCQRSFSYRRAWVENVTGGHGIWEQARLERKSVQIFRAAFDSL